MGNCQAIDAAALVIQHPGGKIERFYWPILASEVMKMNPGSYVSVIIPLPNESENDQDTKRVQFTRVKLLRPTDTLHLGHAYRLVTSQEVMKVLKAKKYAKSKRQSSVEKPAVMQKNPDSGKQNKPDCFYNDKHRDQLEMQRPRGSNSTVMRSKSWRPVLQSISESGS